MSRYLVIAHQTADSYELSEALKERARLDADAQFTLLVPITYAGFLVAPDETDDTRVVARARRVGNSAAWTLNEAGINVNRVIVGDELPMVALEEELEDNSDYSEIIFSTLPEKISRWVRDDQLSQAQVRFGLPVTHIICTPAGIQDLEPM